MLSNLILLSFEIDDVQVKFGVEEQPLEIFEYIKFSITSLASSNKIYLYFKESQIP